jgi:integrase
MIDTTRLDVRTIINGIYDKGSPIMSNRVLACIRKMFAFAVEEDLLEFNVCTAIPKKADEKSCERTLSHEEIIILWELLPNTDVGNATKLLLISGQRTGETRQMEWSEIDNTVWTIPPEKQKKRKNKPTKPHLVPLPTLAMEIIQAQKLKTGGSIYVFAGRKKSREEAFGDRCISEKAISRAFRRIIEKLGWQRTTVHDLRRTMRSELSRLKVNAVVSEKLLNHALPGLFDTYDMHAYFDEKAIALQKWSDCLKKLVYPERKESNVIDFTKERMG